MLAFSFTYCNWGTDQLKIKLVGSWLSRLSLRVLCLLPSCLILPLLPAPLSLLMPEQCVFSSTIYNENQSQPENVFHRDKLWTFWTIQPSGHIHFISASFTCQMFKFSSESVTGYILFAPQQQQQWSVDQCGWRRHIGYMGDQVGSVR